jgi:hypothetical protein
MEAGLENPHSAKVAIACDLRTNTLGLRFQILQFVIFYIIIYNMHVAVVVTP